MDSSQQEHWLRVTANLRVDRKGGIAPHQPLLLLVLAELVEENKLSPTLNLSGELTFRFLSFWTIVAQRRSQKPDIRLPFYHLKTSGIWTPLDENNQPTNDRDRAVKNEIDEDFLNCLRDETFRLQMRRTIIAKYFEDANERAALYDLVGLEIPPAEIVQADAKQYEAALERGREARFRLTVIPAYNYTCALTGYRLVIVNSGGIVDAAHIHQFSRGGNNDPRNGMALCKNAHWMFDEGLWSLDNDFRVLVAREVFEESGDNLLLLQMREGQRIFLPKNQHFWPDAKYLHWHRKNLLGKR